jgi:hypothetical protein
VETLLSIMETSWHKGRNLLNVVTNAKPRLKCWFVVETKRLFSLKYGNERAN